jgi:hypothetical protein
MTKQEIEFRDPVVQSVVNKFVDRSNVGYVKYGKTMRDDKSDVFVWLNHLQEELLDASLYLQRLKEEISTLREEKALLAELNASYADINDIDVIDAFEVRVKKKNRSKPGSGLGDTNFIDPIFGPIKKKKNGNKIANGCSRGNTHSFTIDEPIRFISDTTNSHLNLRDLLCEK